MTSVYAQGDKHYKRRFTFDQRNYVSDDTVEPVSKDKPIGSIVELRHLNISKTEEQYFNNIEIDHVKNDIKKQFLLRIYLEKEKSDSAAENNNQFLSER